MGQWVLCAVMVGIIVRIDCLRFKPGDGIKFLDRGSAQTSQRSEDSPLDLCDLCVLHSVDQGVLGLCGMVLELLGRVFLTKWSDLIEVHLQVMRHFLGKLILRCLACQSQGNDCRENEGPHGKRILKALSSSLSS